MCDHGICFLGKCFCAAGWTGSSCSKPDSRHVKECEKDECYYSSDLGVPIVSRERWLKAQNEEASLWNTCTSCIDDGREHHARGFNFYKSMSQPIGNYIEIGCGPFTQTVGIFGTYRQDLRPNIQSLTLLDPNLLNYAQNVEKNSYKDGKLLGMPAVLIGGPSENFPICEHYDTLTVINVAEHVQNIYEHLVSSHFISTRFITSHYCHMLVSSLT